MYNLTPEYCFQVCLFQNILLAQNLGTKCARAFSPISYQLGFRLLLVFYPNCLSAWEELDYKSHMLASCLYQATKLPAYSIQCNQKNIILLEARLQPIICVIVPKGKKLYSLVSSLLLYAENHRGPKIYPKFAIQDASSL